MLPKRLGAFISKNPRPVGPGRGSTLIAGRVLADGAIRGFRDRKRLILESELRQAYDAFVHVGLEILTCLTVRYRTLKVAAETVTIR